METIQKTGMKKYTLKSNASFSVDLPKETKYDELHNIVRSHYKIIRKSETYLGLYSGNGFQQYLNVEQMMLAQNVKKKSMEVYLFYPKSYNKLKHEEMLFHADVSDEDDRGNSQDTSSTSMTCNNHELLTPLFNTKTDITMTNDFSSILNNSLCFEESFDRKNICLECSCTYTDVCIRCEQNREFEIAQAIDKQKDFQQDNDNDSIGYQLAESNEGNHLMQKKVPSPLTIATVSLKPSVIDVREARIEHFS